MSGNGGMSHGDVCSVTKGLEISPSKTQASSTLMGTKGKLDKGTKMSKGGNGGGTKHKKGSKLGSAERM
jgi:hypothetical protein